MYNGHMKSRVNESRQVIGYVRVSTDEQVNSGAGLEAQRDAIRRECERNGWTLVTIIEDQGISAKTMNRPGLQQALNDLRQGTGNALMAAKLDRLSRSTVDACQLGDMALKYGWDLILLDARIDTTTPHGRAQLALMGTFAQLERELIAQRTREALAVKKAQGVKLGGPVEIPSDVAAMILKHHKAGLSMRAIAGKLNDGQIPTARGGSQWYASTVRVVLEREAA